MTVYLRRSIVLTRPRDLYAVGVTFFSAWREYSREHGYAQPRVWNYPPDVDLGRVTDGYWEQWVRTHTGGAPPEYPCLVHFYLTGTPGMRHLAPPERRHVGFRSVLQYETLAEASARADGLAHEIATALLPA